MIQKDGVSHARINPEVESAHIFGSSSYSNSSHISRLNVGFTA